MVCGTPFWAVIQGGVWYPFWLLYKVACGAPFWLLYKVACGAPFWLLYKVACGTPFGCYTRWHVVPPFGCYTRWCVVPPFGLLYKVACGTPFWAVTKIEVYCQVLPGWLMYVAECLSFLPKTLAHVIQRMAWLYLRITFSTRNVPWSSRTRWPLAVPTHNIVL